MHGGELTKHIPILILPFHDDQQAPISAVAILVHVDDVHNVAAAARPPVQLHLASGLRIIVQYLEEEQEQTNMQYMEEIVRQICHLVPIIIVSLEFRLYGRWLLNEHEEVDQHKRR